MSIKKVICVALSVAMICLMIACADSGGGSGSSSGGSGGSSGTGDVSGGDSGSSGGGSGSGGSGSGSGGDSGGGGSGVGTPVSNLTGPPDEILGKILDDVAEAGVHMPMALPPTEVTADLAHNAIGLSEGDFGRLVTSAFYSLAAIGTFAHQVIMIQANDDAAAIEVKRLISSDGGYDPQKWICVWPESVAVVESGSYVLLVASYDEVVEAAIAAFEADAGAIGEVNTFWVHTGEDPPGGGGLGGGLLTVG